MENKKEPEKGFNLKVHDLEKDLLKLVCESGLPGAVQSLVVERVCNIVNKASNNILNQEIEKFMSDVREYNKSLSKDKEVKKQ